jgi:hypothetical protein
MTGAATMGHRSEAEVMAGYARDVLGVPAQRIMLEEQGCYQPGEYLLLKAAILAHGAQSRVRRRCPVADKSALSH